MWRGGRAPNIRLREALDPGHNSQYGMVRLGRSVRPSVRKRCDFPARRWSCWATYSCNDLGSDSFFGDTLSSNATNSRPEAGTLTLPWRTISLALSLRP